MKKNILKIVLISMLIATLIEPNFLWIGANIANAEYEELEAQGTATNSKNVEFDSYFKQGESSTHVKELKTSEKETLVFNINVKNTGVFNDGKIKIENSNFKIATNENNNNYIKNIDIANNEIELNQILSQSNIVIEVPIEFKKEATFAEDYFESESAITLTGTYKTDKEETAVQGQIKTRILWQEEVDANIDQEIEKYIDLGNGKTLLEQKITTTVVDDKLPRKNENIEIQVPALDGQVADSIYVLLNGSKLEDEKVKYDKESGKLEIANETSGTWSSSINKYKIIYNYKDVEFGEKTITLNSKLTCNLYTGKKIEKENEQTLEISAKGSVVSIDKQATDKIYKGYMYANVANETTLKEVNNIEISDIKTSNIEISDEKEVFVDGNNNQYATNNSVIYKSTQINKQEFEFIFGENGVIVFADNNGNEIARITKDTQADENGNITIDYQNEVTNLKIVTTEPINKGQIWVNHTKAIKGNTGYSKQALKQFNALGIITKVSNNQNINDRATVQISLEDTKTEAKLEVSSDTLTTLEKNENVKFVVTLKNNNEKYDLFKNTAIEVEMPEGIESLDVKSINKLYDENLEIKNPKMFERNGRKVISMYLSGEQTTFNESSIEGTQIVINADVTLQKELATNAKAINLNYTNENGNEKVYSENAEFTAKSKYGFMSYRKITGLNDEKIEDYDNKQMQVELPITETNKTYTVEQTFINNYEKDMENFSAEIKLQNEDDNFGMILAGGIQTNSQNIKAYYLVGNTYVENVQDLAQVKAIKLETTGNALQKGESITVQYNLKTPDKLEYTWQNTETTNITYNYENNSNNLKYEAKYKTSINDISTNEVKEEANVDESYQTVEGIGKVKVTAMSAGKELTDNEEVYEGQTIKYIVSVVNDTNKDLNNFKITATNTNAIYYDKKVTIGEDTATLEQTTFTEIIQNEELVNKEYSQDILPNGAEATFEYEFLVKKGAKETKGTLEFSSNEATNTINTITNSVKEAKLQIVTKFSHNEEFDIKTGETFTGLYEFRNLSGEELENQVVEVKIPENCELKEGTVQAGTNELNSDGEAETTTTDATVIENDGKTLKIKIGKMPTDKDTLLSVTFNVGELDANVSSSKISFYATASIGDETYFSNIVEKEIKQTKVYIEMSQVGSSQNEQLKDKEELTYKTTIKNVGITKADILIYDNVPQAAVVTRVYIIKNGETTEISVEDLNNNAVSFAYEIDKNETAELYIETKIDETRANEEIISNQVEISGPGINQVSNKVSYKINIANNGGNNGGNNGQDGNDNNAEKGTISGIAWLDENQDGERQSNEETLKGMTVLLFTTDGKQIQETKTNQAGKYIFQGVSNGNYLVAFRYDTKKYGITDYQKENVESYLNSDVISKQINGEQLAVTDIVKIENNGKSLDAGFVTSKIFDLSLKKYVNSIKVENKAGTKLYSFDKTTLAKVEVSSKAIAGTKLTIEYEIDVTNEGEVEGYAEDVVDYLPQGMTLSSTNWTNGNSGEIHTNLLANEIIKPGETKKVNLVLTRTLGENDTGTITNVAEIAKANNSKAISDTDSIPGNRNEKEDDYGRADVIISISTGLLIAISTVIIIAILAITIFSIYYYKKRGRKNE